MQTVCRLWTRRFLFVLVSLPLVYAASTYGQTAAGKPKAGAKSAAKTSPDAIPGAVREMVDMLLSAVQADRIDELRDAIDWNEMKPDFGVAGLTDPVAHWKTQSRDGTGRETLALLGALLAGPPAIVPYGRDLENNRLFVWPGFAEKPLETLTESDATHFAALVPETGRAAMLAHGVYSGWRLVLGADGTWHTFKAGR